MNMDHLKIYSTLYKNLSELIGTSSEHTQKPLNSLFKVPFFQNSLGHPQTETSPATPKSSPVTSSELAVVGAALGTPNGPNKDMSLFHTGATCGCVLDHGRPLTHGFGDMVWSICPSSKGSNWEVLRSPYVNTHPCVPKHLGRPSGALQLPPGDPGNADGRQARGRLQKGQGPGLYRCSAGGERYADGGFRVGGTGGLGERVKPCETTK